MTLLNKILIGISILFFVVSVLLFINNNSLKADIEDKDKKIAVAKQNEQALKDEMNQKDSIIQNYAIKVSDLQKDITDREKKYRILLSKYAILYDSVQVINKPAETDTSNNMIKVSFKGKQGKVSYKGETIYFTLKDSSMYSIDINVDKTEISSEIYYDKEDKIIKNRVYADSILITDATTVMDSTVFDLINSLENCEKQELTFSDRLNLFLELNQTLAREASVLGFSKFDLNAGIKYMFDNYELYGSYRLLDTKDKIELGFRYNLSIKNISRMIF